MLSVVLPTLNEEEGIAECIRKIKVSIAEMGVTAEVIVSDSSTDRTPEIARREGAIVVHPDEAGYGYAYRYAFAHARGEYIVIGDADTTYDFEELPKLFDQVRDGDADMVLGSRFRGEILPGAMPSLHRYVGNPLLTWFLNTFYDTTVTDAHSGFRVFDRTILDPLDLESDGMEFASEMIMQAGSNGLTIAEVPITYHERTGDATLSSFRDGWRHVKFMLLNAPTYVYTLPSLVFAALGVLAMVVSLTRTQLLTVTFGTHTAIAGSLLAIVSYQVGSLGVFSSITADPIRMPRDPMTRWVTGKFRLEYGATVGVVLLVLGSAYLLSVVLRWVASGYTYNLSVMSNMLAFTAVVLGAQTVFYSLFLTSILEP
jgi:hypothetical protein